MSVYSEWKKNVFYSVLKFKNTVIFKNTISKNKEIKNVFQSGIILFEFF